MLEKTKITLSMAVVMASTLWVSTANVSYAKQTNNKLKVTSVVNPCLPRYTKNQALLDALESLTEDWVTMRTIKDNGMWVKVMLIKPNGARYIRTVPIFRTHPFAVTRYACSLNWINKINAQHRRSKKGRNKA